MVPELPLIRRELLQLAQRRRTYGMRCLVLFVLSFVFLVPFVAIQSQRSVSAFSALGFGRNLVEVVLLTLGCLLYALAPAMSCGAISAERSRQTLPLLLVSRLTARTIVLEKTASQLIPLFVFLVLSAPLLAISYLFGGISWLEVGTGLLLLILLAVHIVAVAVFWSVVLPGSLRAFWATYGTLFATSFGLLFLREFARTVSGVWVTGIDGMMAWAGIFIDSVDQRMLILFPMYHVTAASGGWMSTAEVLWAAVPFNVLTVVFVWMAQLTLHRWSTGQGWLIDRVVLVKQKLQGGLQAIQERLRAIFRLAPESAWREAGEQRPKRPRVVPVSGSIAWRERQRLQGFATWFAGGVVVLVSCFWTFGTGFGRWQAEVSAVYIITFEVLSLLLVVSLSSRLFVTERERETLETLLACPLSTREILRQKLAGVHLAMGWMFAVCVLMGLIRVMLVRFEYSATLLSGWHDYSSPWSSRQMVPVGSLVWLSKSFEYFLLYLGNVFVFMTIVKWTGVWFGLKTGNQMKAMLGSLLSLLALCFVPLICTVLFMVAVRTDPDEFPLFFFSSPMMVEGLHQNDSLPYIYGNSLFPDLDLAVIVVNLSIYGGLAVWIRQTVLRQLPGLLQRRDGSG